jgi:hypothetical protein
MPLRPRLATGGSVYHVPNPRIGRLPLFEKTRRLSRLREKSFMKRTTVRIQVRCGWGHPLAGLSSRHRLSRGERIFFSSPKQLVNVRPFESRAPVFNRSVSHFVWCAPVTHQVQGLGRNLNREFLPAPGSLAAPENCRYHAVSKVIRITNPMAHPLGCPTQMWLTAWAYHLIKSSPSCLSSGTGQPLIKSRGCEPTPSRAHCPVPTVSVLCQAKALVTSNAT